MNDWQHLVATETISCCRGKLFSTTDVFSTLGIGSILDLCLMSFTKLTVQEYLKIDSFNSGSMSLNFLQFVTENASEICQ